MKACEYCGSPYARRRTEAHQQFEARRFCSRKCAGKAHGRESRVPNEKFKARYRQITTPDGRKMMEHRWVVERAIGRPLQRWEHVHHVNHDRLDNRLENLEVVTAREHGQRHTWRPIESLCSVCGAVFVPHKTKRARQQTCGDDCKRKLMSQLNAERRAALPLDTQKVAGAIANAGWALLNVREREEAIRQLHSRGLVDREMGECLGTTCGSAATVRIRLGLLPVAQRAWSRHLLAREVAA